MLGVVGQQGRSGGDRCHDPGEIITQVSCAALGKSLYLSEPVVSHLYYGDNNTYLSTMFSPGPATSTWPGNL